MVYKRKTRHDYWYFNQEIQEEYLNRRYQLGYFHAGRWLNGKFLLSDFSNLFYHLAIAATVINIGRNVLLEINSSMVKK